MHTSTARHAPAGVTLTLLHLTNLIKNVGKSRKVHVEMLLLRVGISDIQSIHKCGKSIDVDWGL